MTQVIDPKIEKPTREMLGLAIQGELQDLATLVQSVGDERYRHVLALCATVAAYVAVDASERWPTDADIHEIARVVASKETMYELKQDDVYNYLAKGALDFQSLGEAFGRIDKATSLPVLITGSMLLRFCPRGIEWFEYLDRIWNAYEAVEDLGRWALPALQVRTHMLQAAEEREA